LWYPKCNRTGPAATSPETAGRLGAQLEKGTAMLALGGLLISVALLALAASAIVFRSPSPPRWTTWSGELITLAIVAGFALGLANLIAGASAAFEEGPRLADLGLLAAVLVGALVIWRRLGLGDGLRSMAAAPHASPRGPRADLRPTGSVPPVPPSATTSALPPSRSTPRAA
jgi:hypothetical protein